MKKTLFFTLFFLVASTKSYAIDKTLLCSGIKHTGGKISNQGVIDFNFTFDDKKQSYSMPNFLSCEGFGSLPITQNIKFTKDTISFDSKNKEGDDGKCSSFFTLNRNSGSFKFTQIIGDTNDPILIYEGTFQCEIARQKF